MRLCTPAYPVSAMLLVRRGQFMQLHEGGNDKHADLDRPSRIQHEDHDDALLGETHG